MDLVDLVDLAIVVPLALNLQQSPILDLLYLYLILLKPQVVKAAPAEKVVMVALAALAVKVPTVSLTRLPW